MQTKLSEQQFTAVSSVSPKREGCRGFKGESGVASLGGTFRIAEGIDKLRLAVDVVRKSQLHF